MARKPKIPTPKINPRTAINLINNLPEKELLYRTIWNEAGGEGLLGMALVVNSIFNRKAILDQGARLSLYQANDKTIKGILTGKNQFEPVTGNRKVLNPISEDEKQKVIEAIELAGNKRLLENKIKEEINNISNNDTLSLLNSTGFRGKNAKLDKSQNVNVVTYKGHKFNTAGNKDRKLVELEIDRNTPIPKEKPTQEKSKSIAEASDKGIEGQMENIMAGTKRVYDPGEDMVNTEDLQVAKMMRATDELSRSASKEDKLEGFRNRGDDVYIPGIEMEAFDDTKTIDEEDAKRGVGEPVDSTMDAKPSDSMDMFGSSEEDMRDDLSFFETLLSGLDIQDTASDFTESEEDREFRDEQMEPQVEPDAPEDEFQADQQEDMSESEFPGDKLREGGEVKADFDGK